MASADDTPVSDREAAELFAPLRGRAGVALAVSGGADSSALLHLYARARALDPELPRAVVLTVDHGLRPAARAEAAAVAARAAALGLPHRTLVWEGDKPTSDLQAAARAARRRLLGDAAREAGCDALVLAHHADDQAETFLMRLARGSGVVGLAAMAPRRDEAGLAVVRPFLGLAKSRLVATLAAAGLDWVEDPSNGDPRFERARVRAARPLLDGLGLDRDRLTATARAMARAGRVLDGLVADLAERAVTGHDGGWATIAAAALVAAPEEIRLRLLSRLIAAIGRRPYGPRLAAIEALDADLCAATAERRRLVRTLGDVRIEARRGLIWMAPESGRTHEPDLVLAPGAEGAWRGGRVAVAATAPAEVTVAALGRDGRLRFGRRPPGSEPAASAAIEATAPAAFAAGVAVACPALGLTAPEWAGLVRFDGFRPAPVRPVGG